jgi:NDP-sugar pyrophosphorylase family protein
MKAIILAGGKGARLRPYTKILPKPLMPIGDMPILEILLRQMKRSGVVDHAILTVGYLEELLRAFFKNGERFGLQINYSFEEQPLGTAGPISLIDDLNETFLVSNGDVLTTLDLADLVRYHQENAATATIAMHARQVKVDLGVLELDGSRQITGYIEKPTYDFHVSMGIYVFEPRVLDFIPYNQHLDFPDLVLKLLEAGEKVVGYPFEGYWQDLGRHEDYEQAVKEFESMRSQILGGQNSWLTSS